MRVRIGVGLLLVWGLPGCVPDKNVDDPSAEADADTDADTDADSDADSDTDTDTDSDTDADSDPDVTVSLADADARILGALQDEVGRLGGASWADLDGDGRSDLVAAVKYADPTGDNSGAVYRFDGPVTGRLDVGDAAATIAGQMAADNFGGAALAGFDIDGDGVGDVVVGAHLAGSSDLGGVSGFLGTSSWPARADAPDTWWRGTGAGTGVALGWLDADDDGLDDLLIGQETGARVYLERGPTPGGLTDLAASREGFSEEGIGNVLATGDTDGDGFDDLVLGNTADARGGADAGVVFLVLGPFSGEVDLGSEAAGTWRGGAAGDAVGFSAVVGDASGDGYEQVIVGAIGNDAGGTDAGAVYVIASGASGEGALPDVSDRLTGGADGAYCGASVAVGSFFGEHEIVLGCPGAGGTGEAVLVPAPVRGDVDLASGHRRFVGEAAGDLAGSNVGSAGDTDGDGVEDLFVGAWGQDTNGNDAGALYVVFGTR